MKLNRTGSNWTELERNKINENWRIIEGNYNDVVDKVSEEAFDKVVNSAKLNWKEPVDKYADLPSGASEGDTRMVRDSGKVYRFNGEVWQEIQQIDAGPVNELDARLTSQLAETEQHLDDKKMDKNTNDISVNQINKNKGKFDETYMSDEFLQQIAGDTPIHSTPAKKSITSDKMADMSINPSLTTFAKAGKNKFDGSFTKGMVLVQVPGTKVRVEERESGHVAIINVDPNTQYTISKGSGGDRFTAGVSSVFPEDGDVIRLAFVSEGEVERINTGEDEKYLIIYVASESSSDLPDWLQVEKGFQRTIYEPQRVVLDLEKNSINHRSLQGIRANGILYGDSNAFDISFKSKKITTKSQGGFVLVGNDYYNLIDGEWSFENYTESQSFAIAFNIINREISFFSNTKFYSGKDDYVLLGVVRRDREVYFVNGLHTFEGREVNVPNVDHEMPNEKISLTGDNFEEYDPSKHFDTIDSSLSVEELYSMYDGYISSYPDYVTKTKLGESTGGLDINLYHLKTKEVIDSGSNKLKLLLFGNIHGHEKQLVYGLLTFFKDLVENWKNMQTMQFIMANTEIYFIPVVNPDGFNNDERKNSNGVDLNRNFPYGWSANSDTSSPYYPGNEPASEVETGLIIDFINQHLDAFYAIDFHNFGPIESHSAGWLGSEVEKIYKMNASFYQNYDLEVRKKFPVLDDVNKSLGESRTYSTGGGLNKFLGSVGLNSSILELPTRVTTNASESIDEDTIYINAHIIGNYILHLLRNYKSLTG